MEGRSIPMGFDLDIITRSEAAKIVGTSTGNIQRLESLGDFPKRVRRGEPGKPAFYERTKVIHWLRTRRRSSEPQLATHQLRRLFHDQHDTNLRLHHQVEALSQQRAQLDLQHNQLQELHAQLQTDFNSLQDIHDEAQALLLQAQIAGRKLQRLRQRDHKRANERTELLKQELEQLQLCIDEQATQLQQASLNTAQCDKRQQTLNAQLERVRTLYDKARVSRDKARQQRNDAKSDLEVAHAHICALESSLEDANTKLHVAENENLRLQQCLKTTHTKPTAQSRRLPIGRGQQAKNATRQRCLELEQIVLEKCTEIEELRALLDERQAKDNALPRGLAWANDILRTPRKALIQLHIDAFGHPPRRDISIKSLRQKLLNRHGWRYLHGTLVPFDP